jgi:hypothetical protein
MDHKPPRSAGDEREVLLLALGYLRESLVRKLDGLTEQQARSSPVASGTTLLWLVKHCGAAEDIWLRQRFVGDPGTLRHDLAEADTIASVVGAYRATWSALDDVVRANELDASIPDPNGGDIPLSLRWIVVHLIEEIARHAGHADILRELLDEQVGR